MTTKKRSNLKQVIALVLAVAGGLGSLVSIYQLIFPQAATTALTEAQHPEDWRIYKNLPDNQKQVLQKVHVINFWVDQLRPLLQTVLSLGSLGVGLVLLLLKVKQESQDLKLEQIKLKEHEAEQRRQAKARRAGQRRE